MRSLLIALMPLMIILIAPAGHDDEPSPFKDGTRARVTVLDANGSAAFSGVYATIDDAEECLRAFGVKKPRAPITPEGLAMIGHNTLCEIRESRLLTIEGAPLAVYKIRVAEGALARQDLWIMGHRLRHADAPDPAFAARPSILPWDPELEPQVGVRVMCLGFREKSGPKSSVLIPGERTHQLAIADVDLRTDESDLNLIWVAPGTKAVIWKVPEGGKLVKVKLASGPFSGQIHWARPEHLCRPEIYDLKVFGRKGEIP